MSNNKDHDFSKFYKNRMEERLVKYLEVAAGLYTDNLGENIQAQVALVSRSIENIALMLAENGYISNRGHFVRFTPSDLLTIQAALTSALKLRADVMMLPMGLEGLTKAMSAVDKVQQHSVGSGNPHTGLSEPPPLAAVDGKPETVEAEPIIEDGPEVMQPVLLPVKIKS